ncbi:MAG: hypothetical protein GQ533_00925 [Methanosarcinaceae archaeon]|nr:hypothetical protein [Methanosarcinaceae archaeon]
MGGGGCRQRPRFEKRSIHFKNQGKMHIWIVKIKCLSRLSISRKSHLPLDLKRIQNGALWTVHNGLERHGTEKQDLTKVYLID